MRGTVSIQTLVVAVCWLLGAAAAVADVFSDRTFGALSHVFVAAGATLLIVGRLERMAGGWVAAYEAGRGVSRLRSTESR